MSGGGGGGERAVQAKRIGLFVVVGRDAVRTGESEFWS